MAATSQSPYLSAVVPISCAEAETHTSWPIPTVVMATTMATAMVTDTQTGTISRTLTISFWGESTYVRSGDTSICN